MTAVEHEIEHGSEALRLLAEVSVVRPDGSRWYPDGEEHKNVIAAAQVHATLANTVMLREIRDRLDKLAPKDAPSAVVHFDAADVTPEAISEWTEAARAAAGRI